MALQLKKCFKLLILFQIFTIAISRDEESKGQEIANPAQKPEVQHQPSKGSSQGSGGADEKPENGPNPSNGGGAVDESSVSSTLSSSPSQVAPSHEKPSKDVGAPPKELEREIGKHVPKDMDYQSASTFSGGLLSSLSFVIVSELGDKTFFIAAIMSMRYSRRIVFLGAIAALWLMTLLSILIGVALPTLFIPEYYTHYAAIALFFVFGARLLKEAWGMDDNEMGEYEDAEAEINKKDEDASLDCLERGVSERKMQPYVLLGFSIHPIFIQVFTMTFLAEWGDRSQIATIALAARGNAYGVTAGGILGHAFCTVLAVLGGRLAKEQISERTVSMIGGIMFIMFGIQECLYGV